MHVILTVEAVKYLPVAHKHKEHFAPTKRPIYSVVCVRCSYVYDPLWAIPLVIISLQAGVSEPVVFSQAEGFAVPNYIRLCYHGYVCAFL